MIYFFILFLLFIFSIRIVYPDSGNVFKIVTIVSAFILILLAGLRGDIEPDYYNYKNIFTNSIIESSIILDVEVGYYYFNKLINFLGLQFQWRIHIRHFY